MSTDRSGRSHALAWIVTVLVAVPVLYVLTFPVVMWYAYWKDHTGDHSPREPRWLLTYSVPYVYLARETPLSHPLVSYYDWVLVKFRMAR
jgi:hypothetical protein